MLKFLVVIFLAANLQIIRDTTKSFADFFARPLQLTDHYNYSITITCALYLDSWVEICISVMTEDCKSLIIIYLYNYNYINIWFCLLTKKTIVMHANNCNDVIVMAEGSSRVLEISASEA